MTLEELTAKDAIREVIDGFANLELDVEAQGAFFTPDTHVEVHMGGQLAMDIRGADELVRQFSGFTEGVKASHHLNGQQVITLNADGTATDVHYCRAALVTTGEDGSDVISDNYIRYVDTLVQVDGRWLVSHREQHFLIAETRPFNG